VTLPNRTDGVGTGMQRGTTILIVNPDPGTWGGLVRVLTVAGHRVIKAADGPQALALMASARPDLVVLDPDMPTMDGFEVCRRIRLDSRVPIVMVTTRKAEDDVLRGFRLGVDGYVAKPCSARILGARVCAILRRTGDRGRVERGGCRNEGPIRTGPLELDPQHFEARMNGEPVHLTPLEVRVLHLLAANPGRTVSYEHLIEHAWGHDGASPSHLKICISKLRKKLGLPTGGDAGIRAVVGTGYALYGLKGAPDAANQGAA
jgi:two-component system response regulator MtrA